VFSGGPVHLELGVSVGRNRRIRAWRHSVGNRAWPVNTLSGPLSAAGSCRPSPDRHTEATPADCGRRSVLAGNGCRVGSLLLQGFTPMFGAPLAAVYRVHPDHGDAAAGSHRDETGAEITRRDRGHGATQPLAALAASQSFASGGAGVGKIKVLHHHRPAATDPSRVPSGLSAAASASVT
jgi:hypothetical protein